MNAEQIEQTGHWLVGNTGAERSVKLVSRLRESRESIINERFGLRHSYTPWHSLVPISDSAIALVDKFKNRGAGPAPLICDRDFLSALAEVLRGDGEYEFAALRKKRDFESTIHTAVSERSAFFTAFVEDAVALLKTSTEWLGRELETAVDCYVPIFCAPGGTLKKRAMTCVDTHGAVYITLLGRDPAHARVELAVDIAHELGHHLLMGYQLCDPIISSDRMAPVYSGVRKTLRPAIMSLHAACALAFMIASSEGLRERSNITSAERAFLTDWLPELRSSLEQTISSLKETCQFTPLGEEILEEFCAINR